MATLDGKSSSASTSAKTKYCYDIKNYHSFAKNQSLMQCSPHGIVADWDVFESIWDYSLSDVLKADSREVPVLMAEKPYNPTANRHRFVSAMFFVCLF